MGENFVYLTKNKAGFNRAWSDCNKVTSHVVSRVKALARSADIPQSVDGLSGTIPMRTLELDGFVDANEGYYSFEIQFEGNIAKIYIRYTEHDCTTNLILGEKITLTGRSRTGGGKPNRCKLKIIKVLEDRPNGLHADEIMYFADLNYNQVHMALHRMVKQRQALRITRSTYRLVDSLLKCRKNSRGV